MMTLMTIKMEQKWMTGGLESKDMILCANNLSLKKDCFIYLYLIAVRVLDGASLNWESGIRLRPGYGNWSEALESLYRQRFQPNFSHAIKHHRTSRPTALQKFVGPRHHTVVGLAGLIFHVVEPWRFQAKLQSWVIELAQYMNAFNCVYLI